MSKSFNLGKIVGADGKSAYMAAKEGGFVGSEEDFNTQLATSINAEKASEIATTSVKNYILDNPETEFLNVKNSGAKGDGITDDSESFKEGVPGYIVNDGVYCVDGSTMAKLNSNNCIGNGYLKLCNPELWGNDGSEKWYSPFDYTIAVKDLDDVLQKQMVSVSEADYYSGLNRKNATSMLKPLSGSIYGHTIGAVYKIQGATLPDNFTVCIGNLHLYSVSSDKILRRLQIDQKLSKGMFGFYELPWTPQVSREVSSDKYKVFEDYTEFYLSASDFEGTAENKTESVLHIWGNNVDIGDKEDIVGVIACFDFWIKEEEAKDKLIMQVGVDLMDYNTKSIRQACSGIAMKIENYPRTQWATSMNRELLNLYCNSNYLAHLHSLPASNIIGEYSNLNTSGTYEKSIVSLSNGDLCYQLFKDSKSYRSLQLINPVKHMCLPYYNTSSGSTGEYCKLFSIPKAASSTNRYVFKINYTKNTSTKVTTNFSTMLSIIRDGNAEFNNVYASNVSETGLITVLVTDSSIDVYAKGSAWGYVTVDIELLVYSSIDTAKLIEYDSDLLRVGAGSQSVMCDKWTTIDTTNSTVIASSKTTSLEERISALESKIAALEASN